MHRITLHKRIASLVLAALMLLSYVPVAVWAVDSTTDIKAIEKPTGISIVEDYDDYYGENWLEKLELPKTVKVTLADNTITEAMVTWDTSKLDTRTTGYYALPGTVSLPAGATNGKNVEVSITVQVRQYVNLISNPGFEQGTTNWVLRGLNNYIATDYPKSGSNALMFGNNATGFDFWNTDYAALASRVAAKGSGQYYFAVNVRQTPDATANVTNFYARIHYASPSKGSSSSPVLADGGDGNKITVSKDGYVKTEGICTLTDDVTYVRLRCYASKNVTTTWETTGLRFDDVELVPLKVALQAEPAAIVSVKTELLSRALVLNYDKYVENWKAALELPTSVEVVTDNGSSVNVDVTWTYGGLDFTKYGKYVLEGKLDDSSFPNPSGITVKQTVYVTKANNIIVNGNFENGNVGWSGWLLKSAVDPDKRDNHILLASKPEVPTGISGSMIAYQKDTAAMQALAEAFKAAGEGQYYFGVDAMTAPYDANTPAREDMDFWLDLRTSTSGSSSGAVSAITSSRVKINPNSWTTVSVVGNIDAGWNWMRTDIKCRLSESAPGAVYLDNFCLIPINVVIPKGQEPSEIVEILDEIPIRAIVQNYDKYVGETWQAALGLPTTVQVRTANGNTAAVSVEWDFSNLNLNSLGKYYLVGKLDSSVYPNPNELYVQQIIHVRDYINLLQNPSFEDGTANWSVGSGAFAKETIHYMHGATSMKVTTSAKLGTSMQVQAAYVNAGDNVAQKELGKQIAYQGAGQYYFSAWSKFAGASAEGFSFRTTMLYKQDLDGSNIKADSADLPMSTKDWVQASGIINIPANVAWARLDLYLVGVKGTLSSQTLYLDNAELIPLNVVVEQYEGSMKEVESIIADRQVIQNYPDYIGEGYTTDDLMLPKTVNVRSTSGELIPIEVRWDYSKLDLTKPGTYTVYGSLSEIRIDNPNGLTVQQKIRVVSKQNLLSNASFENDGAGWGKHSHVKFGSGNTSPVRTGDYSLKFETGRMESWTASYLQAFYNNSPDTVGQKVTKTGAGKYYFGGWAQGTASTNDIEIQLRMLYRNLANGDKITTTRSASIKLSATSFTQFGDIVEMPDDIYWARLDMYLLGTTEQMRLSTMYLEDFELIPLNVEVPNLTDIISCEDVADIYVHEGSSIEELNLPETLQVIIKTGQKFEMGVTWDTDSFNPNHLGEQVITGALNLGKTYKNPKNFVPIARIVVRAKNEDLRQTIYISTSGSEDNDGLSPDKPKKEITGINTYFKQGYNVRLKRGDTWYIPTGSITLSGIYATEDAPLTFGAYGDGKEQPTIAYMLNIANSAWKLVDEQRNIYAADVSSLGERDGITVHRCFVEGEPYTFKNRTNYTTLKAEEYCSYGKTLYVRMPEGEVPRDIEVTPYTAGHRILINNVTNLTIEHLNIKGGGGIVSLIFIDAPTENVKWKYCNITHVFNYVMMWETDDEQIHYKPEVSHCYIDANLNKNEGNVRSGHWAVSLTEGIVMRDGVESGWIHHNLIRNMSHCFITIESTSRANDYVTTGVRNTIIEENVLEGGNARYARAFGVSGGRNAAGIEMGRNNIVRRNRAYDMTTSGHLFGVNNLIYSNLISYVHCEYTDEGELFDGKSAQPWGFDTLVYSNHGSVGNMLVNNTFFNVSGAIAIYDKGHTVYNNIYANNLIVNFTNDAAVYNATGAIYDHTIDLQYVMNNGVYSSEGVTGHFVVDNQIFSADDVNNAVAGYSANIYADPKFVDADLSNMEKYARMEFTLSSDSPMRYAGLSLYADVYKTFPMWERLEEDYADINGVVFLAESPSIGAYSYDEKIRGDVAEVGKLDDILMRPGATFEQLNLPDAVPAKNDQGIEVMLLTTWSSANFDSSKPGTITLSASLRNGPHTDLNIKDEKAYINVNIKDKLELLNITTILSNLTVLYGSTFEEVVAKLPQSLDVMEESGFQEALPVTWSCENYNPIKPDTYTFKCVLPEDMLTNAREFNVSVEVRVLHEIGRGTELLVNPDFIDGTSAAPWTVGWGTGSFKVTTDPEYLYPGEPASAIVTVSGKYASLQQNVLGQLQLMGDGKYLFKMYMRTYEVGRTIDSTVACLKVFAPDTYTIFTRTKTNVGTDWVEMTAIMDVYDVDKATEIIFHTSTYKTDDDVQDTPKSYVISGCSLIYLGETDAEVEATKDSIGLVWNEIKGENSLDMSTVMSDLNLPSRIGSGSAIKWTSSDESVITNDGKVTMGRVPKDVTMTATITYKGIETVKKFKLTVPRDPSLPTFTGTLTGDQTVLPGEEFQVTISLSSDKATSFNGYRFTLSFNASKVEYVGISDPTSTVTLDGGKLVISGVGTERPVTDTITVTFKALKTGITEVKLVQMEMDLDPNVSLDTLPVMSVVNGAAVIDVQKVVEEQAETVDPAEEKASIIWIVIGVAVAVLVVGTAVAVIVIKKKRTPKAED